jgi:hypothetical protein
MPKVSYTAEAQSMQRETSKNKEVRSQTPKCLKWKTEKKEVGRQDTHFGSRISDWGLKNRQNIEAEKQDPKSAFQNPKCIGSIAPVF